ncbi:MAG TPA: AAA family ATPase [Ensifer sp.]|jgi:predicted ATPase|uniref:AAA family ATPase n=1 Tax=Ensifer sp. TaxID=1872086 RepID=UPI002E11337D|nr:AAA family ATPase [Ensifer sp.]
MATSPKLDFISLSYDKKIPEGLKNTFVVQGDNWDDYGSKVRFGLFWFDEDGEKKRVGTTKILHGSEEKAAWVVDNSTTLPAQFSSDIGSDFISLGQSKAYYVWMHDTFGDDAHEVLSALRDIAIMPGLAGRFETSTIFRNGMMRENVAWRSRQFGSAWSLGDDPIEEPSFAYTCLPSGDEQSFLIEFDFSVRDILPGRVVGVVGRNAVGKTRFLAQLSADLTQSRQVSAATVEERKRRFPNGQPLFTRVLAVSYSAFDRFRRPIAHAESSYVYCGIRDEKGNLSQTGLQRSFHNNKARVRDLRRDSEWVGYIAAILGEASDLSETDLRREIDSDLEDSEMLGRLSSGQAILCHFVTGLLAWLQPESLVLFDEPETHLHPNAVANLFVVLTNILRQHKSYAIVATHSPIVIQEIPSKRVMQFTREDGVTYAAPLEFESFGESVAELTEHVFKTQEAESLYRDVLNKIAKTVTLEEALELFTNRLSMNAKSYLLARYAKDVKQ